MPEERKPAGTATEEQPTGEEAGVTDAGTVEAAAAGTDGASAAQQAGEREAEPDSRFQQFHEAQQQVVTDAARTLREQRMAREREARDEGAPHPSATERAAQSALDEINDQIRDAELLAKAGDGAAKLTLTTLKIVQAQQKQHLQDLHDIRVESALERIPDEVERRYVKQYFDSGDYRTVEAARKAFRGDYADWLEKKKSDKTRKTDTRVRAAERDEERPVRTATRPAVAERGSVPKSVDDLNAELDKAIAAGDGARQSELRRMWVTGEVPR